MCIIKYELTKVSIEINAYNKYFIWKKYDVYLYWYLTFDDKGNIKFHINSKILNNFFKIIVYIKAFW